MTDSLPSDFTADGQPFENPEVSADTAYAATTPSLGAKLGADFGEGLTAAIGRAGQRGQQQGASWFDRLTTMPDVDTAAGMVAGGQDPYPEPAPSPTISADEANKRFAPPGTTIADGPMSEGLARVVGQQKADEVKRDSVFSRYAAGHGTLTNLGVGLALSPLMDPVGTAAMFVPGIGEEAIAAHLGEGLIARTAARVGAGASAGAIGMGVVGAAKYALGTEQDSDYTLRSAMYDMAGGAALGALGHAGFGALREAGILKPDGLMQAEQSRAAAGLQPAEAPTGLVSNEDLGAVVDAPATARFDALNAGVAQMLDGREVDVAPIFDQVRADRAEADLQRWTAQQGRLDQQSTAALQASSLSDAAAGTVESRAAVLQQRLDDLRDQHAGFLDDIERAEAQRTAQTDIVTPQRLQAIDDEMADPGLTAARRQQLEAERSLLTEGRDSGADALEAARTEAQLQGLQRGAAALEADMAKTTAKVEPLQAKAAAQRAAGSEALGTVSDRIGQQEKTLQSLAARSIRRYAGAFGAGVTRDEADALALRTLRGGPDEVAKVVAEIRGRAAPSTATATASQPTATLAGPPIEQQRAVIANDVTRQLVAAGRPEREARAHGRIVAAHYEARASRFGGALGTAEDLYRQRAAEIRGPDAEPAPATSLAGGGDSGGAAAAPDGATTGQMLADRGQGSPAETGGFSSGGNQVPTGEDASQINAPTGDSTANPPGRESASPSPADGQGSPPPAAPIPGLDTSSEPEIAPGEPATPQPEAVEQVAAEVMPEAVEPVRAAVDARDAVDVAPEEGQPAPLPAYSPEASASATARGPNDPAGVFMFDPVALNVDAERFQFKTGGDAYGVTGALRGVTRWDPAKAQALMVWEQADGRLFVADGHQRSGLARRLTESGEASGLQLPGILYREADGISDADMRAMAAVTNIANGSGSALDGAKVLRARPDLMDGSVPLSAGKGQQAAALARLDDEAFRMVVNEVVPENFGAVVGQIIPSDGARQVAALKAIARFEPRSVEEATALTQRVSSAELARAEEGRQASLFGDLDAPESTAGEEMRIVARAIKDMRRDRGLFSRVIANASRLEEAGSTIERGAARSAATDAGAFAKILSADVYTAGPTRTALIEAARDLRDGKASIGDASARLYAALRRSAQNDGPDRLGARLGHAASEGDADGRAGGPGRDGDPGGAADVGTGRSTGDTAARPGAGSGDGLVAGDRGSGREGGQGGEDAAASTRRGNRGATAGDGVHGLVERLIADGVPRTLFQGMGGEDPFAALMDSLDRAEAEHKPVALVTRPMAETGIVDPHASTWRLYHGTGVPEHFDRFDPKAEGSRTGGAERGALFTSPRPDEASTYAENRNSPVDAAGARIFPLNVRPGNTAVYDVGRLLAERDPRFMAASRAEFDAGYGAEGTGRDQVYADALRRFDSDVAHHEDLKQRLGPDHNLPDFPAASNLLHPQAAAIRMAREDGRDTAIIRGLGESAGGDQVVVLKPGFAQSAIDPEHLFYQGDGRSPRGSITFRPGERPLLRLMADADASTFVHEMGHDWLEQMMRDAAHPAAPDAFRADAQAVRGWLGSDGGVLTEAQHERFATSFEQYLRAGEAPAPELAGVFAQLKDWLTRIYRSVTGLGAPISPDIKAVFDRLLTAEPERPAPQVPARPDIAALAQRQQAVYRAGYAPGMPQAEFDALNESVYGAKAPADGSLPNSGDSDLSSPNLGRSKVGSEPGPDGAAPGAAQQGPKTAADALLATWQQRFDAAGVVPTAEERALIDATRARVEAADLSAEGYAQAGACLTAAGI